jgi:predicted peroxiredoxin
MKFKRGLILLGLSLFFLSCQTSEPCGGQDPLERDGIFIHISHGTDDPHRVLMALQMAALMSETKDVLVYFDIAGVEVVLNDAEDLTFSHFPSSKTQLKKLIDMNIPVQACPGCLKAAGKTADDLMEGIQVANKEAFFNFTKGRILTIDY